MKVFKYYLYDDDFYSANSRVKNERYVNVLAVDEHEADSIMLKNYPKNGIGKDNFECKGVICIIHHKAPSV